MSGVFTVDAGVFVSAFTPSGPAHQASKAFLRQAQQSGAPMILPTLVIVEIAVPIGRGQGKPDLGYAFALELGRFPGLTLIALDDALAREAAELAARHCLRGSDAVYVAVARRFAAALVTLDSGQAQRTGDLLIPIHLPAPD